MARRTRARARRGTAPGGLRGLLQHSGYDDPADPGHVHRLVDGASDHVPHLTVHLAGHPTGHPSSTSTSASPGDPAGGTTETACDEVRAGIAAFNDNDFDATVEHFVKAVPLATAEEAQKQTKASADLLEAVEYYAELPAGDYLEASVNSLDFEKYKIITLGQCEPDPDGAPTSDPSGDGGGGTNI